MACTSIRKQPTMIVMPSPCQQLQNLALRRRQLGWSQSGNAACRWIHRSPPGRVDQATPVLGHAENKRRVGAQALATWALQKDNQQAVARAAVVLGPRKGTRGLEPDRRLHGYNIRGQVRTTAALALRKGNKRAGAQVAAARATHGLEPEWSRQGRCERTTQRQELDRRWHGRCEKKKRAGARAIAAR